MTLGSVEQMWDSAVPKLLDYVTDTSKFQQETWEDLILRLLSETIRLVNDVAWTRELGQQYTDQLEVYNGSPDLKRLCMKHLGLVLQKTEEKRFIRDSLSALFDRTNHLETLEREGCAQAYGYCSTTHLDITVDMLTQRINEAPPEPEKKGFLGGLFSSAPQVCHLVLLSLFLPSWRPGGPPQAQHGVSVLRLRGGLRSGGAHSQPSRGDHPHPPQTHLETGQGSGDSSHHHQGNSLALRGSALVITFVRRPSIWWARHSIPAASPPPMCCPAATSWWTWCWTTSPLSSPKAAARTALPPRTRR